MIMQAAHVVEECPVCGRPVEIRCEYVGLQVLCRHCGGEFVVTEKGAEPSQWLGRRERLTEAADRLLQTSGVCVTATAEATGRTPCHGSWIRCNPNDSAKAVKNSAAGRIHKG